MGCARHGPGSMPCAPRPKCMRFSVDAELQCIGSKLAYCCGSDACGLFSIFLKKCGPDLHPLSPSITVDSRTYGSNATSACRHSRVTASDWNWHAGPTYLLRHQAFNQSRACKTSEALNANIRAWVARAGGCSASPIIQQ